MARVYLCMPAATIWAEPCLPILTWRAESRVRSPLIGFELVNIGPGLMSYCMTQEELSRPYKSGEENAIDICFLARKVDLGILQENSFT